MKRNTSLLQRLLRSRAGRIVLLYAAVGTGWILLIGPSVPIVVHGVIAGLTRQIADVPEPHISVIATAGHQQAVG